MRNIPSKTQIYADLMQEVKDRLEVIGHVVTMLTRGQPVHPFAQAELGFLQLRYICELIALATCVAHEPSRLSKAILKSWNAEKTFALLDNFNEHCFPRAVQRTGDSNQLHFQSVPDTLDAQRLKEIYNHCGQMLHRGPLKKLLSGEGRAYDVNELHRWASLIGRSLASHSIVMPEQGSVIIVSLATGPDRQIEVVEAVSADGSSFAVSTQRLTDIRPADLAQTGN